MNTDFPALAAQIIPVLALATALEVRAQLDKLPPVATLRRAFREGRTEDEVGWASDSFFRSLVGPGVLSLVLIALGGAEMVAVSLAAGFPIRMSPGDQINGLTAMIGISTCVTFGLPAWQALYRLAVTHRLLTQGTSLNRRGRWTTGFKILAFEVALFTIVLALLSYTT